MTRSTALSVAVIPFAAASRFASEAAAAAVGSAAANAAAQTGLQPPAEGPIPVAFLISEDAVVIDFCGPWEVFRTATVSGRRGPAFRLYTVAETAEPLSVGGGMRMIPNFTFRTAPSPKVLVIPAQSGESAATVEWIRQASRTTDVTMSVCTGAFLLAKTGLLNGKAATTHHNAYSDLAMQYPQIQVRRGARFVEAANLASAGGLSSGIDLSLRVVERYFGRAAAAQTADYLEYQGLGWTDPNSNEAYRNRRVSTAAHPLCPVCDMEVDPGSAPKSVYRGQTYFFCMPSHKQAFDKAPEAWLEMLKA
ncbi:MAG TPA: DJ-1/PfpI family protein [Steroidobacteraceae bacterium]